LLRNWQKRCTFAHAKTKSGNVMIDSPLFAFEKLRVYQLSRMMAGQLVQLIKSFPKDETFALSSQLRRAVISIPSNIAEGSGRVTPKEQLRFVSIAYGSLMEVYCQLQLSHDFGYISEDIFNDYKNMVDEIGKLLSGLRKSLLIKIESEANPSLNSKQ
jgi:four helix bundle protein